MPCTLGLEIYNESVDTHSRPVIHARTSQTFRKPHTYSYGLVMFIGLVRDVVWDVA